MFNLFKKEKEFNFFKARAKNVYTFKNFDFFGSSAPNDIKPEDYHETAFFRTYSKLINRYMSFYTQAIFLSIFLHLAGFMTLNEQFLKMQTAQFNSTVTSLVILIMMFDLFVSMFKIMFSKNMVNSMNRLFISTAIYIIGTTSYGGMINFVRAFEYVMKQIAPVLG